MRMVVGLHQEQDRNSVVAELRTLGATDIRPQVPSLPDVVVAEFGEQDADKLVRTISGVSGVRYAEPDQMQTGL